MSGIGDWFHVSKEEQEQRRSDMSRRVFRFGDDEQRPVVARVLNELYGNTRRFSDQDQLFGYISARNVYAIAFEKDPEGALAAAAKQLRKLGWRDGERVRLLLALLDLDGKAPSLAEYPTADQVRSRANMIPAHRDTGTKTNHGRFKF